MKKNSKYIVLTAAIALCAGSSLPFLAGSSTLNPERDSVKSEVQMMPTFLASGNSSVIMAAC